MTRKRRIVAHLRASQADHQAQRTKISSKIHDPKLLNSNKYHDRKVERIN